MTENFCGSCNRLRVSATGQLHACLARDDAGDLRAAMRSSDPGRLEQVVRAALGHKRDTHGFELDGGGGPDKAMISIGG
jgi:cyclic pyranopterin phosphate synthase